MKYSIAITTFDKRFHDFLVPLVRGIKQSRPQVEIILMVNGTCRAAFNETFRRELLAFTATVENCFPTLFPDFQSLAKMWNRGVLTATEEQVLLFNDDLHIPSESAEAFFSGLEQELLKQGGTFKINGSYSHFVVTKKELNQVGYFDERLLGIGEEDGDFTWRYYERYGRSIPSVSLPSIENIRSQVADVGYAKGVGHYSRFNRAFVTAEKYQPALLGGHKGMFDQRMKKKLSDEKQYPYEEFLWLNRYKV